MSEIARLAVALTFLASLFGMAAFLIYKQTPGWGWFLAAVTIVVGSASIEIDKKPVSENEKIEEAS